MKTDIFRLITSLVVLALFVTLIVTAFGFMRRVVNRIGHEPFSIEAVRTDSGDATVTVKADRRLCEGEYIILFDVGGENRITVTDESGTEHGSWLADTFGKGNHRRTYTVHGYPEGTDILRVSIVRKGCGRTYMTALGSERN